MYQNMLQPVDCKYLVYNVIYCQIALHYLILYSFAEFKEMLLCAQKGAPRKMKSQDFIQPPAPLKQRLSAPDLDIQIPVICKDKKKDKGFAMFGSKPRLKKALMKMNLIPKNLNNRLVYIYIYIYIGT